MDANGDGAEGAVSAPVADREQIQAAVTQAQSLLVGVDERHRRSARAALATAFVSFSAMILALAVTVAVFASMGGVGSLFSYPGGFFVLMLAELALFFLFALVIPKARRVRALNRGDRAR